MSRTVGIGDSPLAAGDDELLGITPYASALASFVRDCATPMTIGLQGDWGSGKTSLMNLIEGGLNDAQDGASLPTVWVNTWQFSQIGVEEALALSVLRGIVDGLAQGASGSSDIHDLADKSRAVLGRALRWTVLAGGSVLEHHTGIPTKDAAQRLTKTQDEPAHQVALTLKKSLAALVQAAAARAGRVVLFIDDLDRVPPLRAVQILEALKNFLDVPQLVTVLACDYGVIVRGLDARMGVSEAELGRSFFDKIIQVPFRMPVHAYAAESYVIKLLAQVGVEDVGSDLSQRITAVLRRSIGLNPRGLKRHANTLLLLMKVAQATDSVETGGDASYAALILLALVAIESSQPALHRFIARSLAIGDDARVRALLNRDPDLLNRVLGIPPDKLDDLEEFPQGRLLLSFVDLLDQDRQGTISEAELAYLKRLISLSSVASVGGAGEQDTRKGRHRRQRPWTADELVADVRRRSKLADEQKRYLVDVVRLCQRLETEGVVALGWGKGMTQGSVQPKVQGCQLFSFMSTGHIGSSASWIREHLPNTVAEAIITQLYQILSTEVPPVGDERWPDILPDLLARDPDLSQLEQWMRDAAALAAQTAEG